MTAFLIVDMQNDFMLGGALGVPGAKECIPVINRLVHLFSLVIVTQDWHPQDHVSFVTSHPNKQVGDIVMVQGTAQILWPVHCVRNTLGAELVTGLDQTLIASIFYKGTDKLFDSYSAFFDDARHKSTGLADYLHFRQIRRLIIAGVAMEYCVLYTVLDAMDLGFKVTVIEDACSGINLHPNDVKNALDTMRSKGAEIIRSESLFVN